MSEASSAPTGETTAPPSLPDGAMVPKTGTGWLRPWQKGQSGNPTGAHGEYFRIRRLCAENSYMAVEKLLEIIKDDKADERVVYLAVTWLVERGLGKPRDHSADGESVMDLTKLSVDERKTLLELMSRVMGLEAPK